MFIIDDISGVGKETQMGIHYSLLNVIQKFKVLTTSLLVNIFACQTDYCFYMAHEILYKTNAGLCRTPVT